MSGWLAGYIATDGSVDANGVVSLSSSRREHLEYVADLCDVIGIGTQPIRTMTTTAGVVHEGVLYAMTFLRSTLPEALFLRDQHLQRFRAHLPAASTGRRNRARCWRVEGMATADELKDVYSAIVPTTGSLVIEGQILTGAASGPRAAAR